MEGTQEEKPGRVGELRLWPVAFCREITVALVEYTKSPKGQNMTQALFRKSYWDSVY